jgi:hypothetical protein
MARRCHQCLQPQPEAQSTVIKTIQTKSRNARPGIAWTEFKRTYIMAKRRLVFKKGEENTITGSNFLKILNAHNFKEFDYALGVHLREGVDAIKNDHWRTGLPRQLLEPLAPKPHEAS